MIVWFLSLAVIGVPNIVKHPQVLQALNPWWGVRFFMDHGWHGIFIARRAWCWRITGGEALYADMGHFGTRPIRYGLVLLRAAGADAQLLRAGRAAARPSGGGRNPFY